MEYHDLLDLFFKKNLDTLPLHQNYDYKIILEKEQKHGHVSLYKVLPYKLNVIERYRNLHLAKGLIQASLVLYSSPVLFIKKSGGGNRFSIDYWKLNTFTKKKRYSILLIEETLAQLQGAKYFTKIDIYQGFYSIKMA